MARRVVALVAGVTLAVLLAGSALANDRVRATLTRAVPADRSAGQHVLVAWKLRDSSGRAVLLKRVTLRIVCPTGDASTTTVARLRPDGTYRVSAVVPPGGIGTLSIGANKQTFPITNPPHR